MSSMEFTHDNDYFAARDAKQTANILMGKAEMWYSNMEANGYLDKLRMMWAAYHGVYYTDFADSHQINFGGEQGELSNIAVNHLRNLAKHIQTMITADRPVMKARATNTDNKSLIQTRLADGLLEYYNREKKFENYFKKAVEYAIILGSGWVKLDWNELGGEIHDILSDGTEIREGDVVISNLSPFDVYFDPHREDQDHDWIVTRSFKLRHNIIAKYPEYKDRIMGLATKAEIESYSLERYLSTDTDLIPVYEFYHKKCDAMPDGRYIMFLDDEIVLSDGAMPYRELPVYRISPGDILGTPYGYTDMFDVLQVQDAYNALSSIILTNQNATGIQSIWVESGSNVDVNSLEGGLNLIESNTKPEPLQFTATPSEVFEYRKLLMQDMETISGVNAVTRGNPENNVTSGTALALLQSNSLQFMSALQQQYIQLIEDVGTGLIYMLRDFARVPRIAMIVGKSNRSELKQFSGDDLSQVNRVHVEVGNPLAVSMAGRLEIAQQLLQMKAIQTPEQFFQVLSTGKLETMTELVQSQLDLVRDENEKMMDGMPQIAVGTDNHALHIREHSALINDVEVRQNPQLLQLCLEHINEHTRLLRETDPGLLAVLEQQPLSPLGGTPNAPMGPQQTPPQDLTQVLENPEAAMQPQVQPSVLPPTATPPPPYDNKKVNVG